MEDGRRKKEEGGRRKKEEGRRQEEPPLKHILITSHALLFFFCLLSIPLLDWTYIATFLSAPPQRVHGWALESDFSSSKSIGRKKRRGGRDPLSLNDGAKQCSKTRHAYLCALDNTPSHHGTAHGRLLLQCGS